MTSKIEEIGDTEVNNNEDLLSYVNKARKVDHTLYLEYHWMADQLEAKLANIKGVRNRARAKKIAQEFRKAAEAHKQSANFLQTGWTIFEQQFDPELKAAKRRGPKPKEPFTIV